MLAQPAKWFSGLQAFPAPPGSSGPWPWRRRKQSRRPKSQWRRPDVSSIAYRGSRSIKP